MATPVVDGRNNLLYAKSTGAGTEADPVVFNHADLETHAALAANYERLNKIVESLGDITHNGSNPVDLVLGQPASVLSILKSLLPIYYSNTVAAGGDDYNSIDTTAELLAKNFTAHNASGNALESFSQIYLQRTAVTLLQELVRLDTQKNAIATRKISANISATTIKNSPSTLQSFTCYNASSGLRFAQLFNKTSMPSPGDIPHLILPVAGNSHTAMGTEVLGSGVSFSSGIAFGFSSSPLDFVESNDDHVLQIFYR